MSKLKYNIGDRVYYATFNSHVGVYVECPDCGGTGRIRCILHDETTVSINCGNCSQGYDPPTGRILIYDNKPDVENVTISGVEVEVGKLPEYKTTDHWYLKEDRLFSSKEDATAKALELHEAYKQAQRDKVLTKEKDKKSWAWNASYHRGIIRRAEKDIVYHTAKLNVANLKKKEK